jgi:hypothetical protein
MPKKRTKEEIRPDLIIGLSRAVGDAPTILLYDLRECVGRGNEKKYVVSEHPEGWLEQDFEDGFRFVNGVRNDYARYVQVDRVKLLEKLEADAKAPAAPNKKQDASPPGV